MTIEVRRAYDHDAPDGGQRFLVDRLWPRGVKKAELALTAWLKDVAPSDGLRRWFAHDPDRWAEFVRRYRRELDEHPDSWGTLREAARRGPVVLLYGAKDEEHNNAVALRQYLESKNPRTPGPPSRVGRHGRSR